MFSTKFLSSLLLLLLPLTTLSSPTYLRRNAETRDVIPTQLSIRATPVTDMEPRAVPIIVIARVISIVDKIIDLVESLKEDELREIAFIGNTTLALSAEYPDYNVLVYHDDPGKDESMRFYYDVNTWVCQHVERDRTFGTKGYEVCLLQTGYFIRGKSQHEGYRNWGWRGCVTRVNQKELDFCQPLIR